MKGVKTDRRSLRNFGLLFAVVFCVIAGISYYKGGELWPYALGIAPVFLLLGLLAPSSLRGFYRVWMAFAAVLAWIMTRVVLSIAYFLVFVPIGLMLRLIGKDILDLKMSSEAPSYWVEHEKITDMERYKKQY
jgi:hypothetical protein